MAEGKVEEHAEEALPCVPIKSQKAGSPVRLFKTARGVLDAEARSTPGDADIRGSRGVSGGLPRTNAAATEGVPGSG